jgi:hypothetical protein
MVRPVIDVGLYARRAIERVLGKSLDDMTPLEGRLWTSMTQEVARAIIDERQGVAQIVLSAIEQAKAAEKVTYEKDRSTLPEVLDDIKRKIDLRSAATPEMVERLAIMLRKLFDDVPEAGGIDGLNRIGGTTYNDFSVAANQLVLGQAPCALEDDLRVWSVLVDAKVFRFL